MPTKSSKRVAAAPKAAAPKTPPSPFEVAPSTLQPLLAVLDRRSIYITHVDSFPRLYKRRIFLIPIVLNLIFAVLIALRVYYAVPKYLSILSAMLGLGGDEAVDMKTSSWRKLFGLVASRGIMIGGDWLLLRVVGSWPYTFFLEGPDNACTWRWKCGFKEKEVVVRQSRRWGTEELLQGSKRGDESAFWRTKILPAVDPEWMAAKTGYLMMGRDWDLDFEAMVVAQQAVDKSQIKEVELAGRVFAWDGPIEGDGQWVSWRFQESSEKSSTAASARDEYGQTEEEGAQQMVMVRDKLASMGKEGLFFRMIEVAQYETTVPGRTQAEKERITLEEVQKLFASNGIDFAQLMEELDLDWPGLSRLS